MHYGNRTIADSSKSSEHNNGSWLQGINGVYNTRKKGVFRAAIQVNGVWVNIGIFRNVGAAQMAWNMVYVSQGGTRVDALNDENFSTDMEELKSWMGKNNIPSGLYDHTLTLIEQKKQNAAAELASYEQWVR